MDNKLKDLVRSYLDATDPEEKRNLIHTIREDLDKSGAFQVIDPDKIKERLAAMKRD